MNLDQKISDWLKNYLTSNKLDSFVIGVSGGIDSAVTSTLCALTNKPVIVVSMPIHQAPNQLQRAHNHINWLQTSFTGNKVEDFGVGFFTKYGDGGVDISPIADLTKTEVRQLAKEIGVSNEIVQAPPTDGLWGDNRTDEDQIGASYEELEGAMDYKGDPNDLFGREQEVYYIYQKHHKANQHKMLPIPIFKQQ